MATPIQEPNDIPSGEITDANAGNYAVVVYKKDNDGAGLKKLGLAPWKQFLGFNSHKVTNVATWVGVPPNYYDVDADQDPPDQTLVEKVNQIRDNAGVSDQPQGSGFIPLNTRVGTLEDTVGTPTSGGVLDGTTVCAKVEENSDDITDIETFLGDSSSASGSNNVSGRLQSVEGKVNTLQTEVETANTGLLARATAIEGILGTPSSGSVIVPGSNSVCQQVEHNTGEIEELWDSIGGGGGGGSSSLTSRIETLEQDMPTKADLTDLAPIFSIEADYSAGDYVIYEGDLYRFTASHNHDVWNGSDVTNVLTVGNELATKQNSALSTQIAGQSNVEGALGELDTRSSTNTTNIGTMSNLDTQAKSNLVSAVNEVVGNVGNLNNLSTSVKTDTVSAINEVVSVVGDIGNLTTDDTSDVVSAINSLVTNRGDLSTLQTSDKTSLVGAVNEVVGITDTLDEEKADISVLASEFNSSLNYNVGDYVSYENKIYRFAYAHVGTWSDGDVVEVTITGEIKANSTAIGTINDTLNTPSTGVIARVGAVETQVETNTSDISTLKSWVGNSSSAAGDPNLSGRMLTAESDIAGLKATAGSAYKVKGNLTQAMVNDWTIPTSWESFENGDVYNASEDLVINVPASSPSQLTVKADENIVWVKGATGIYTYGYFDKLSSTINLTPITNAIEDLEDDVDVLNSRYSTPSDPANSWSSGDGSSSGLKGRYIITVDCDDPSSTALFYMKFSGGGRLTVSSIKNLDGTSASYTDYFTVQANNTILAKGSTNYVSILKIGD